MPKFSDAENANVAFRRSSSFDDRSLSRCQRRVMSFDDAEEARLDALVDERFQHASLEALERQMLKNFGTTDVVEMPEGMVKRAIVMWRFNRLYEASEALLEACESDKRLWERFSQRSPIPEIELSRGVEL